MKVTRKQWRDAMNSIPGVKWSVNKAGEECVIIPGYRNLCLVDRYCLATYLHKYYLEHPTDKAEGEVTEIE
jgi:hypothetical protein